VGARVLVLPAIAAAARVRSAGCMAITAELDPPLTSIGPEGSSKPQPARLARTPSGVRANQHPEKPATSCTLAVGSSINCTGALA